MYYGPNDDDPDLQDSGKKDGPRKRKDPRTDTDLGSGIELTDPTSFCTLVKYTRQYTETQLEDVETQKFENYKFGALLPTGTLTFIGHYVQTTYEETWVENSCEPGVKMDVVKSVIDQRRWKEPMGQLTLDNPLNGVGVPQPIPSIVEHWIKHSPFTDPLGGADEFYRHPEGAPGSTGITTATPKPQPDDYDVTSAQAEEISSERGSQDLEVELRRYGFDTDNDELAHLSQGPGFGYRDREVLKAGVNDTITKEELKGTVSVNDYTNIPFEEGTVVKVSFVPLTSKPRYVDQVRVTYGWWLIRVRYHK